MQHTWQQHYQKPDKNHWHGRDDGVQNRLHQYINCVDATNLPATTTKPHYALLGFASDCGVHRNQGRIGAKAGPDAIRKMLSNLPLHDQSVSITDVGNIVCDNDDLEKSQQSLANLTAQLYQQHYYPILLGGGHEMAWGHYLGIEEFIGTKKLGIINFDAHFDLRPLSPENRGSSGTPFLQIANQRQQQKQNFDYMCIGIQPSANTNDLFTTADNLNVTYLYADKLTEKNINEVYQKITTFINNIDVLYLTLCLDVFAAFAAPGVSAPQALGLLPKQVLPYFRLILQSNKVVAFDIAEMNPTYDIDNRTAKLAASFVFEYLHQSISRISCN